jgi:L-galactose dehydrogenase
MSLKAPHRSYGNGDPNSPCSCANPNLPATLPILGLGCSSFSTAFFHDPEKIDPPLTNPPSRKHPLVRKWIETIHHAILNCGITLLDTAPWYGHGISEFVIGFAMEDLLILDNRKDITRADLVINTKVGRYDADPIEEMFDFSAGRVRSSVLTSIERMKCSYIDVLQLHDPEFTPSLDLLIDETIPAMIQLRDIDKVVKAIGMTGYSLRVQHELIHRTYEKYGVLFDQSLTYCHYTLFDQSLFDSQTYIRPKTDLPNASVMPSSPSSSFANYCKQNNVGLLAAAPLSMGLLTQKSNPPTWHPASAALKDACKKAAAYCDKMHISLTTMALLYAFGQEKIPCTILGMKDIEEVDRAMEVVRRFVSTTPFNDHNGSALLSLPDVLTEVETNVLNHLLDQENDGPFATVSKLGELEWDGVEVENFWKLNPCSKLEAERRMRLL